MANNIKKVLVFGAFDGIHDGHRFFLKEARKCGDELIVAVAKDSTIKKLKGHLPETPLPNRIVNLKKENLADKIIPGDQNIGEWKVIKRLMPDIVCLGYDQKELRETLEKDLKNLKINTEIIIIKDFNGKKLHSSLIKKKESDE
jgi:FAD synthetase